jgi:N-acetylglucosaminyldiphosphoundecaprenol N-acetyl-beta-D-mannosaminyltransferase
MHPRVNVLGVGVSAINLRLASEAIDRWIQDRQPAYICVAAAHSIMDCQRDPGLRRIFNNARMVTPDGMSLVWLLRLQGHQQVSRVYGPDLLKAVFHRSTQKGHRHFLYGGTEVGLQDLGHRLRMQYPAVEIAGAFAPPFRALTVEEDRNIVELINRSMPDIVWVGIGSPRQERWMAEHRDVIQAPVMVGVGAAFDFLSGSKRQAPEWVRAAGLEWLFRLVTEPRRLWPRYREYPRFVYLAAAQLVGLRSFPFGD